MISNIGLSAMAWISALRGTLIEGIKSEEGQGIIEYVVLAGAISLAAAFALVALDLGDTFQQFADTVKGCLTFDAGACS